MNHDFDTHDFDRMDDAENFAMTEPPRMTLEKSFWCIMGVCALFWVGVGVLIYVLVK